MTLAALGGCAYSTPPRGDWPRILLGASNSGMTPELRLAKTPLYQETGGRVLTVKQAPDYMNRMEAALEGALRKPGVQINRIGTDIVVILVRSSFIYTDSPEISRMGDDLLKKLSRVLAEFGMTWVEITGYTDAMANQSNAAALSRDMATRAALYLAKHDVQPIRLFIDGRGSSNPIADQSDIGRLTNLRIEIRLSAIVK